MSFSDFLEQLPAEAYNADTENAIVGGAIRYGLENGISGSDILRGLQGIGLGVRRQTFYQLVRNERANQQAGRAAIDANLLSVPLESDIPQVAVGRAGTYVTNMRLTYRVGEAGGEYHLEERMMSVTSRAPISPADAMSIVQNVWAEHSANYPNLAIFDLAYTGTVLHTGRG